MDPFPHPFEDGLLRGYPPGQPLLTVGAPFAWRFFGKLPSLKALSSGDQQIQEE